MLNKTINIRNNRKPNVFTFNFKGVEASGEDIMFQVESLKGIQGYKTIGLVREDGKSIYYAENMDAELSEKNGEEKIKIKAFPKRILFPKSIKKVKINEDPTDSAGTIDGFILEFSSEHFLNANRDDIDVKGYIINGQDSVRYGSKRCNGDTIIAGLNQDVTDNIKDGCYFLFTKDSPVNVFDGKYSCGIWKNTRYFIENPLTTEAIDVFVPVNYDGTENPNTLIAVTDKDLSTVPYFFCHDERFIHYDYETGKTSLKKGTFAYYTDNDIKLSLPMGQNFSLKMNREEEVDNYADIIAEENINGIIDYERYQFVPYFRKKDDSKLYPATEIEFNLHFRERDTENGWKIKEDGYWNNYVYNSVNNSLSHVKNGDKSEYLGDSDSDLVSCLGFDDSDVNYQSMALQQSFIRLSFYDTPFRGNQNLLFYNTIFLDSNRLFSRYSKAVSVKLSDGEYTKYQWSEKSRLRLDATFNAFSKYSSSGSSEGFYLYLFKGAIQEGKPIYMKVEFNHAKYGTTVPFIMPISKEGEAISPVSKDFPINYYTEVNGKGEIDMSKYGEDLYIPIMIDHDEENDIYRWYAPKMQDGSKLVFNMFEPRLNPYAVSEYTARGNGDLEATKLEYNQTEGNFAKTTLSIRETGERQLCSKAFLKTVTTMSINGKIVKKCNRFNFTAASTYDVVYELSGDTIANGAFETVKGLTELYFNDNIAVIGSTVSTYSSLNEIHIGKGCVKIGKLAFASSIRLRKLDLSHCTELREIGDSAFQGSTVLSEINFPNHPITIKRGAFGRTAISKLVIPSGSIIGRFAFSRCYNLDDLTGLGTDLTVDIGRLNDKKKRYWYCIFSGCDRLVRYMDIKINPNKEEMTYKKTLAKFTKARYYLDAGNYAEEPIDISAITDNAVYSRGKSYKDPDLTDEEKALMHWFWLRGY